MTLGNTYKIHRVIESWYPSALAVAVFCWLCIRPFNWITPDKCRLLAGQYVSIFSAFFGFAFASMAVLLSFGEKDFVRGMKQSGALEQLIRYHTYCLIWCVLGILCGAVMQFCPTSGFSPVVVAAFISVGVGAILSTWRIMRLFFRLLGYLGFI